MLEVENTFSAGDLGLEGLNPEILVNISGNDDEGNEHPADTVTALIDVTEEIKFHRDLDNEKGDPDRRLFTPEGDLTSEAEAALKAVIAERYKGVDLTFSDDLDEDFRFTFTLTLDVPASTTVEDLSEKIWYNTALVQFHNEADPGTFDAPYLFGSLLYEKMEELAK